MNYIKRFQNAQDLSVPVGNSYSEDQLMHIFLDKFHQGGKYSSQISSHKAELTREDNFTDQKYLSITYLQTQYLNLDRSSGSGINNEIENIVKIKFTFFGGANHSTNIFLKDKKGKLKSLCGW